MSKSFPLKPWPKTGFTWNNSGQHLLPWLVPIFLIAVWQIASSTGLLESRILPAPSAVVLAFWNLLLSGELWTHVQVSAGRAISGLLVGVVWVYYWDC